MRVLLSTMGSRGDVQPVVALAVQLRALSPRPSSLSMARDGRKRNVTGR